MSSGPENRFIKGVHSVLPPKVYRMKNHNPYNGGIPDCWYSGSGADLWVEYKFLEMPKRLTTLLDFCDTKKKYALSDLQQEWLKGREEEGRGVGVIVGTATGGIWLEHYEWCYQWTAEQLHQKIMSKRDLADLITRRVTQPT